VRAELEKVPPTQQRHRVDVVRLGEPAGLPREKGAKRVRPTVDVLFEHRVGEEDLWVRIERLHQPLECRRVDLVVGVQHEHELAARRVDQVVPRPPETPVDDVLEQDSRRVSVLGEKVENDVTRVVVRRVVENHDLDGLVLRRGHARQSSTHLLRVVVEWYQHRNARVGPRVRRRANDDSDLLEILSAKRDLVRGQTPVELICPIMSLLSTASDRLLHSPSTRCRSESSSNRGLDILCRRRARSRTRRAGSIRADRCVRGERARPSAIAISRSAR
jgi:hypothetical protein